MDNRIETIASEHSEQRMIFHGVLPGTIHGFACHQYPQFMENRVNCSCQREV